MVKRPVDGLLAAILLLAVAPLLAVAAVGIRLASPGPILYRAARGGLRGRLFTMFKLRTMHVDQGRYRSAITAHHDPRIFRFRAWLRRAKIDQAPQLCHGLRGDLRIV